MIYEVKKDEKVHFYNVTFDKEKLEEILEILKNYSYISFGKEIMGGSITKWPATQKNIQRRVSSSFYSRHWNSKKTLLPKTITRHQENNNDIVSYEYSFEKLPDLYHYIDILINIQNIYAFSSLFGFDRIYNTPREQLCMEGILNYINSPELVNHNSEKTNETNNEKYDYKGLNKLYKETLECFNFKLIAIKEYIDSQEIISGLSMQRKKLL